jgi:glycogen synthase
VSQQRPRRLILLTESYPPHHPGGAGKYARTLARGLAMRGHHVDVVCTDASLNKVECDGPVRVHRVEAEDHGWSVRTFKERRERILPMLKALHAEHDYDLIHDIGGFLYAEVFRDFVLQARIPGLTHLLLLMKPYLEAAGSYSSYVDLFHDLQQLQCSASRAVITTSRSESHLYKKLFDVPAVPEFMVHNAIDPPSLDEEASRRWRSAISPEGAIVLLMAGRIGDIVKGGDRAVSFFHSLLRSGLNVRLVTTDLKPPASKMVRNKSMVNLGRLDESDFTSLLGAVDFVLCPSRYEAFGLLAVEAGAIGTPVIASKTGGHLDTIGSAIDGILLADDEWECPTSPILEFVTRRARNWSAQNCRTLPTALMTEGAVRSVEAIHDRLLGAA